MADARRDRSGPAVFLEANDRRGGQVAVLQAHHPFGVVAEDEIATNLRKHLQASHRASAAWLQNNHDYRDDGVAAIKPDVGRGRAFTG
jgi:hypothetical protein